MLRFMSHFAIQETVHCSIPYVCIHVHICSDGACASDEERNGVADGNLWLSPNQMATLMMNYFSLTTTKGVGGYISILSNALIFNDVFPGDQRLRFFLSDKKKGRPCGTVSKASASEARGPGFEPPWLV